LKQGLSLVNCEGVIDSDYVEETFLLMVNHSHVKAVIEPGTRLAQAELIPYIKVVLENAESKPSQKTDRAGGMGSTGTK
jgi:dUTPase